MEKKEIENKTLMNSLERLSSRLDMLRGLKSLSELLVKKFNRTEDHPEKVKETDVEKESNIQPMDLIGMFDDVDSNIRDLLNDIEQNIRFVLEKID